MSAEKHTVTPKEEIDAASKQAAGKPGEARPADKKEGKEAGKEDKTAELTNLLQHLQADFENYKKRTEKEQQNNVMLGKVLIVKRILPVLDTFDHALKEHKGDQKEGDGLKRIHSQLISALEAEGLRPIRAVGEKLDPYRHDCLEEECSAHTKGIVLEEIQKGYMLNEFVVRHSLVKVSSGKPAEKKESDKKEPDRKEQEKKDKKEEGER